MIITKRKSRTPSGQGMELAMTRTIVILPSSHKKNVAACIHSLSSARTRQEATGWPFALLQSHHQPKWCYDSGNSPTP